MFQSLGRLAVALSCAVCLGGPAASAALAAPAPAPAVSPSPVTWRAVSTAAGQPMELVVALNPQADGSWTGTLDVPAQGARGIPLAGVSVSETALRFDVPSIQAHFEGTIDATGAAVGSWKQGWGAFPMTFSRGAVAPAAPEVKRPQTPQPPFPYRAEEVRIPNAADHVTLAGTLTLPQGKGPFPVAVMITGSGPQDRDETLMGHKPFAVIADALTRRGVAVLRFDDRGIGGSTGDFAAATSFDFAHDVEAAVRFVRARPDVDPARVGLIGHSEGGVIAPVVAAADPRLAFVVLLAGTGLPGSQIVVQQLEDLLRAQGLSGPALQAPLALQRQVFEVLGQPLPEAEKLRKLDALLAPSLPDPQARAAQLKLLTSAWYMTFLKLDPRSYLARVKSPVLALNGGKDLQVSAALNLPAIEKALKQGGDRDVTVRTLPGLNHLFQKAPTGQVSEYAEIEETIDPLALQLLGDWVVKHARVTAKP